MSDIVVLAYDMDDTLCLTGKFINDDMTKHAKRLGLTDVEQYIKVNRDHMSTMLYPPEIKQHVDKHVIGPGLYMLDAEPSELMETNIIERVHNRYKDRKVIQVVCSHRGFHQYGEIYTRQWMQEQNVVKYIDAFHMLDGKTHPNKIDFLRGHYSNAKIVLLDDNPLHDFNKEHEKVDGVVIYDWVHQFPGYKHQDRYNSMAQLFHRIDNLLGV